MDDARTKGERLGRFAIAPLRDTSRSAKAHQAGSKRAVKLPFASRSSAKQAAVPKSIAVDSSAAHRVSSRQLYIDLAADDAVVLDVKRKGSGVEVVSFSHLSRPETIDPANAAKVGAWIKDELASRDGAVHPVSFACRRHDAILKRIDLTGAAGKKELQLAPMVTLQMSRHLPFPMVGSALDYVPLDSQFESNAASVRLMGAVLPAERLRFLHDVAHEISGKNDPESIGLHAAGAWALLAEKSRATDGAVLGIAIGVQSSSIVVLEAGRMMFVRRGCQD